MANRATDRAREPGLDRLTFPGYLRYPDLSRVYAFTDIFIHPEREEGWGNSVAEGLACGLPVLTSDLAGDGAALAAEIERRLELDATTAPATPASRLRDCGLKTTWCGFLAEAITATRTGAA